MSDEQRRERTSIEKMRALGMSEGEIVRALCDHDFGTMCESNPFGGCIRTCLKCGQKVGTSRPCWELKAEREARQQTGSATTPESQEK